MPTDHTNQDRVQDTHEDTHEDTSEDTGERLRAQLDAAVQELTEYRTRVRDRAIKGFRDGTWALDKLNDSLEELDLEPFEPAYVHTTRSTLELSLTIAESDYDDARAALRQLDNVTVRYAIQNAISGALSQNTPTVSVPDGNLTVTAGYLHKVMVD